MEAKISILTGTEEDKKEVLNQICSEMEHTIFNNYLSYKIHKVMFDKLIIVKNIQREFTLYEAIKKALKNECKTILVTDLSYDTVKWLKGKDIKVNKAEEILKKTYKEE